MSNKNQTSEIEFYGGPRDGAIFSIDGELEEDYFYNSDNNSNYLYWYKLKNESGKLLYEHIGIVRI